MKSEEVLSGIHDLTKDTKMTVNDATCQAITDVLDDRYKYLDDPISPICTLDDILRRVPKNTKILYTKL